MDHWSNDLGCAITVSDAEGNIVYMNDRSKATFAKYGDLIGKSLFDYHPQRASEMIRHMMASGDTNCYTVKKNGIRKLIFQTPWRRDGEIAGMVEFSIPLPEEMPHYDRDAAK